MNCLKLDLKAIENLETFMFNIASQVLLMANNSFNDISNRKQHNYNRILQKITTYIYMMTF